MPVQNSGPVTIKLQLIIPIRHARNNIKPDLNGRQVNKMTDRQYGKV